MHHNDAPNLDPRSDITDLFVFRASGRQTESVFVLNVHPEARARASAFDPRVSYELKVDTNADFEADIAFHVLFSDPDGGHQAANVMRATNDEARGAGPVGRVLIQNAPVSLTAQAIITTEGPYLFFAGLRSDPFFADPIGFQSNLQWTGRDFWAGKSVLAIVLQVPNNLLGSESRIGIWARTMARVRETFTPVNQMGLPGNNVFTEGADTNTTPPARQRERFMPQYVAMFQRFGYSQAEAAQLASQWLPDILRYDYAQAARFPNGRQLSDDVLDTVLTIMTKGKTTADLLGPHTDLLSDFPYLGVPTEV